LRRFGCPSKSIARAICPLVDLKESALQLSQDG